MKKTIKQYEEQQLKHLAAIKHLNSQIEADTCRAQTDQKDLKALRQSIELYKTDVHADTSNKRYLRERIDSQETEIHTLEKALRGVLQRREYDDEY